MVSQSNKDLHEEESSILGDRIGQAERSTKPSLQPASSTTVPSNRRARSMSAPVAAAPTQSSAPYVEPYANPNIPEHFRGSSVRSCDDLNDPDFPIFAAIESEINRILDQVKPYFASAYSDYGTIGRYYTDEDFDIDQNPKVISIELDGESLPRWAEVDRDIRGLVTRSYHAHKRQPPPIRYYGGGYTPM